MCALPKRDTSVSAQVHTQARTQRRRGGLSACHLIALRQDLSFTGPEGSIQSRNSGHGALRFTCLPLPNDARDAGTYNPAQFCMWVLEV